MKLWITKWAATSGVIVVGGRLGDDGYYHRDAHSYPRLFTKIEAYETPEAAALDVIRRIDMKLKALDRQRGRLVELRGNVHMGGIEPALAKEKR